MACSTITVTEYLLERLKAFNVRHVYAVPGDFIGDFLDVLETVPGIERVSTTNELEAGYAADGYARQNGLSCLAVQYGVGTYSALNAVAGAARERVAMVVVTGAPPAALREKWLPYGIVFHHSTTERMETDPAVFAQIAAAAEVIRRAEDAAAIIDRVLETAIRDSAPVYLQIWKDVQTQPIPHPAPLCVDRRKIPDAGALAAAVDAAMARIAGAERPVLWGGGAGASALPAQRSPARADPRLRPALHHHDPGEGAPIRSVSGPMRPRPPAPRSAIMSRPPT